VDKIRPLGEIVVGELGDLDALKRFCADVDTIVHLAADPSPSATWQSLLDSNIVGTYHVFAAAKAAGSVRRVIYASSIHAVSGYPKDVQVHENHPVNPGDLYGVSKCFGEALCRYMAEQEGVSAIAIRIGAFQPLESAQSEHGFRMMDAFVSQRDLNQLIHRCIDAADTLRFAIFHGLSDNRFKRMDISSARQLVGYAPETTPPAKPPNCAICACLNPCPATTWLTGAKNPACAKICEAVATGGIEHLSCYYHPKWCRLREI
jgi:hypothetical protein